MSLTQLILIIAAAVLIIYGVVNLVGHALVFGAVLLVAGLVCLAVAQGGIRL